MKPGLKDLSLQIKAMATMVSMGLCSAIIKITIIIIVLTMFCFVATLFGLVVAGHVLTFGKLPIILEKLDKKYNEAVVSGDTCGLQNR
jgi:hypothetical protein